MLRDPWDNIKCTNIHIIEVPEGEKKEPEKIFEQIIAKNFPNVGKEMLKSRKHKESHTGFLPRRNIMRHILIKLIKIKDKKKILKATKEMQQITYKRTPIRLSAEFSAETLQVRRGWQDILKVMKGINLPPRSQTQKQYIVRFYVHKMSRIGKSIVKKESNDCQGLEEERNEEC